MYLLFVDSSLTEYIYEKKRKFNTQRIERQIIKCFYSSDELNLTTVYNVDIDSIRNLLNECGYFDAEIKQIKLDIRQINKSVAVIEHDHGQKLSALFDAFTVLTEKSESHEDKIKSNQAHLEKHDDEIYYLKSKVQGL